jgi:hypothetical protein
MPITSHHVRGHAYEHVTMVLILLGPFAILPFDLPPPSLHDHDLYMLPFVKYNSFFPKTYVLIRAYVIIKIYVIMVNVIKAYTTIGLCLQRMLLNITHDLYN